MDILSLIKNNPGIETYEVAKSLAATSYIEEALIIASSYRKNPRNITLAALNLYEAQRLYERLATLLSDDECALFSVEESLRVSMIAASPETKATMVETLYKIRQGKPMVIVTHTAALVRHLPRPEYFDSRCISLKLDDEISMNELKEELLKSGYTQVSHIDQPLTFAMRGGIVDVYSMNYDHPIRIEFFDTMVDSIRFFDIDTQKTIEKTNNIVIIPASEILFDEQEIELIKTRVNALLKEKNDPTLESEIEIDLQYIENYVFENKLYLYFTYLDRTGSLLDYIGKSEIVLRKAQVEEHYKHLIEDNVAYIQEMSQEKKVLPRFAVYKDLNRILDHKLLIEVDPFADNLSEINEVHLPKEPIELLVRMVKDHYEGYKILFSLRDYEVEKITKTCIEQEVPYELMPENPVEGINLYFDFIFEGFEAVKEKVVVITSAELFEVKTRMSRYANKFKHAEVLQNYNDLNPGDYVVHQQYGVGQYMGIETRLIMGNHRDYLNIVYRGNSQLLVPLDQFRLVRKFVSREGVIPKLNKLGGDDWNKTKQRLKENVDEIADRLVKLYADRRENIGFAFPADDEEQLAFEKSFAYKLTPDQERAVQEMKEDMMSDKPMDRLLCGDVGFGKTEVAIRGAFKAVLAGKQVAFLCPTTILSEQHFRTFMDRFKDYPVDIRVLNRFATPSYVRDSLDGIKKGSVDVLIGTHRILSKDVQFKDLGLLIIDEEQRFGVEHKEKIKELKSSVDVITLSATPIPRTLQMSLVGIRQLSQLDTPPENRYPVQTYIVEKNGGLIKEVIQKELAREGQVFYLHNNVEQIYNTARKIKNLVPKANIGIAHGQMNKEDIEEVMLKFNHHEIDVLVCTTIIETGLDIPNANTILVEDAQNFGLAQLYQIKGRVGRSNRLAYAYLMIPEKRQLSEVAEKRLKAIKEFTQLGSGYKIAMRDLTIRGAGDLLGPSQSGFIDTVGIDMYIEMLNEAINEKKGIVKEEKAEMKRANINLDGYIPEGFAPDDYDKISLYQQIDKIETLEEWKELLDKVSDEFGKLPKNVQLLFDKKQLDILINDPSVEHYGVVKGKTEIVFTKEFSDHINGVKLFEIMNSISKDIQLKYVSNKISVTIPKCKNELQLSVETIIRSKEAINKHAHR